MDYQSIGFFHFQYRVKSDKGTRPHNDPWGHCAIRNDELRYCVYTVRFVMRR